MTFGIVGASGFIGKAVTLAAIAANHQVIGFSRKQRVAENGIKEWRLSGANYDLSGIDILINLSGYPIDKRWNDKNKVLFHNSRIGTTEQLIESLKVMPASERPSVFLSGSAVGIYGDGGDQELPETAPNGSGYLAELTQAWENAAKPAEELGMRLCFMRIGFVLGRGGEAYEKLVRVFRYGLGGKLGSGNQWMPWIHIDDIARAFVYAAENTVLSGPVNLSAPYPERNKDLTKKLAKSLNRPALFAVPSFMLKIIMGGFGSFLLTGQRVFPKKLESHHFNFSYPRLENAFEELTLK